MNELMGPAPTPKGPPPPFAAGLPQDNVSYFSLLPARRGVGYGEQATLRADQSLLLSSHSDCIPGGKT
jgi:hypothetical protein